MAKKIIVTTRDALVMAVIAILVTFSLLWHEPAKAQGNQKEYKVPAFSNLFSEPTHTFKTRIYSMPILHQEIQIWGEGGKEVMIYRACEPLKSGGWECFDSRETADKMEFRLGDENYVIKKGALAGNYIYHLLDEVRWDIYKQGDQTTPVGFRLIKLKSTDQYGERVYEETLSLPGFLMTSISTVAGRGRIISRSGEVNRLRFEEKLMR